MFAACTLTELHMDTKVDKHRCCLLCSEATAHVTVICRCVCSHIHFIKKLTQMNEIKVIFKKLKQKNNIE